MLTSKICAHKHNFIGTVYQSRMLHNGRECSVVRVVMIFALKLPSTMITGVFENMCEILTCLGHGKST